MTAVKLQVNITVHYLGIAMSYRCVPLTGYLGFLLCQHGQYEMDGIMHNWYNPFFVVLSNQALKVLTFLVNQAAEIKVSKA